MGGFIFYWFYSFPQYLATIYKLKAANSLVESLFYIVTFLRHTSNLERAIDFAAEHLPPPLSFDFKKILWDVENGTYSSIKESIYNYLKKWEVDEPTYCQAMSIVITSLEEGNEQRRLELLDNALDILLTGTFEKMLKYTHDLQQPVTMIHMIGVVLPMLATVMLPLAVSFMPEVRWYHIALLYNLILPVFLVWKSNQILATRPSSAGFSLSEVNLKVNNQKIIFNAIMIFLFFFIIGIGPSTWMKWLLVQEGNTDSTVVTKYSDIVLFPELGGSDIKIQLLEYRTVGNEGRTEGPYSFIAAVIGLLVVFGVGFSLGYYFLSTSSQVSVLKDKAKKIEEEFLAILIQLGNRLNEGLPVEIAFKKMYETLSDSLEIKNFFQIVVYNLENRGMGIDESIFDPQYGAVNYYPSPLISSVMRILLDAGKKGPRVAGVTMINIAEYLKKVREINRRVNDLLAESISGMKSIINFLGPVLNGIVIALSAMISTVIVNLQDMMQKMGGSGLVDAGSQGGLMDLLSEGMPSYYFHIINGLYVISVVYVLSELISVLENGPDDTVKNYTKGKNLKRSVMFYFMISASLTFIFCFIAIMVIGNGIG